MRTILHLLSAAGGGTERYVRELAEGLPGWRHLLLLLGDHGAAVLEDPVQGCRALLHEIEVDRRRVLGLLDRYGVDLLHLHWVSPDSLPWMRALSAAQRPFLVSLHDIGFLRAAAFDGGDDPLTLDRDWVAAWQPIWNAATAITSPSGFIDQQWARVCPQHPATRVAPGLADPTPVIEQLLATTPTVGIVGALGPHKGSEALDALLPLAAGSELHFVLIGYQDRQLYPAVSHEGRLTVHGPYLPGESAALIDRYQVDLVWFPNRMPESFSYALSEAWAAGRPVLVPDAGALGERLQACGGGWLLRDPDNTASVLGDLRSYLPIARSSEYRARLRRERTTRVPTLSTMLHAMQTVYDTIPPANPSREPWADAELNAQLADQLGALRFRQENVRLARDYAQAKDWIAHLERDLDALNVARREEQVELRVEIARRDDRIAALEQQLAASTAEQAELQAAVTAPLQTLRQQAEAQRRRITELERDEQHATRAQHEQHTAMQQLQAQLSDARDALQQSSQQLSTLWSERAVLSIKAHRYDRVLQLIPGPLIRLTRALRRRLPRGR
jgi:glycosyltransferase involved in cell wall biosynthesis